VQLIVITSIIFSKDRPLQLDLTLKSIKKNLKQCSDITVVYKTKYDQSYKILQQEHDNVNFVKQDVYLLDSILKWKHEFKDYTMFFTDDNIVYRPCGLTSEQLEPVNRQFVSCISLRLGVNTNMRDYGDGVFRPDNIPQFNIINGLLNWNRLSVPPGGYWAYPLSVDGHIFSTKLLMVMLNTMNNWPEVYGSLQTPNKFEALLQRFFFEIPPFMMCEKYSCVVNSPNNRVQEEYANSNGLQFSYSPDSLNDLFLQGKRIDLEKINFGNIASPHQEIDILQGLS
jgi:hypothetical protein